MAKDGASSREGVRNSALEAGGTSHKGPQRPPVGANCCSRHMGDVCRVVSRLLY